MRNNYIVHTVRIGISDRPKWSRRNKNIAFVGLF